MLTPESEAAQAYPSKVLQVLVAKVLKVLDLLRARPGMGEAVQMLLVVLTHLGRLLGRMGTRQTRVLLVGLAERVRGEGLIQKELAGVQRNALWGGKYRN